MYVMGAEQTPFSPGIPGETGQGGVLVGDQIFNLREVSRRAGGRECGSVMDFVNLEAEQRQIVADYAANLPGSTGLGSVGLREVRLHAPLGLPSSVRDFYAFEQHVKTARANRGLGMIPEWYDFPVFYFSNHRAITNPDEPIPYPRPSQALDFELEMACVIGQAGRNIEAAAASPYIAGYMIMNDWSARDLQMEEMKLNMGPVKGKDFATSLGPWLVTPDELADVRLGEAEQERFDLTMTAPVNGQEISRGNFKDIYFSFPQMIERASRNAWLIPGDVIGSGTVGTGCLLEQGDRRERYLQPGDLMELTIDRLGTLRNVVAEAEPMGSLKP